MTLTDALLPEYDHEMGTTRRLLECAPEQEFGWKPHEKSMSLGRLTSHLAEIPAWASTVINDSEYDIAAVAGDQRQMQPQSRGELLATFDKNVAAARATIAAKSDAELKAPWTLKKNGREVFTLPQVAALRSLLFNHLIHHRGQLSVYLRLKNVPLPPIYGPTADEGG